MNFADVTEYVASSGWILTLSKEKEHRKMNKNAKQPSNVKKGHNGGQRVQGDAQPGIVRPAQAIAEDEVEIGKTGGKPGTKSTPLTERKP